MTTDQSSSKQHLSRRGGASVKNILVLIAIGAAAWIWWSATGAPSDQGGTTSSAWLEDYDQAVAKAQESGRPILVNFTGSDWCGWCVKLRNEVFDTGVFAAWAKDHVVLLECDFPRTKPLSQQQRQQNGELADRYHITGFPTILVISAQGDELTRAGYRRGGAQTWITALESQLGR